MIPAVVVAEAVVATKALLRLEGAGKDVVLARLCGAAIGLCEAFLGQAVVARGFEEGVAPGAGWQMLAHAPVQEIAGAGLLAIDIDAGGRGWVRVGGSARVSVAYTAGLAVDWAGLPEPIAQGVAMLAMHLFEHREGDAAPPAAVAALWRPYRRMRIARGVRA